MSARPSPARRPPAAPAAAQGVRHAVAAFATALCGAALGGPAGGAASLAVGAAASRVVTSAAVAGLALTAGCGAAAAERKRKEQKAEFHYKLAVGYFHARNIDLAIRELVRAFEFDAEHAESRYLYGFILFGRKRHEEAAENFRRALQRNPRFFAARNHLGVTYLELERFHEAIEVIEPLLAEPLYTTPYLAHNNIGWAYLRLGNLRGADKHLRMAVFVNPKFCLGYRNLGLLAKEQRDLEAAVRHLEDATRLCPNDFPVAWWELGELLSERQFERAQAAFRRCQELAGDSLLGRRCAARIVGAAGDGGAAPTGDEEDDRGWR